MSFTNPTRRKFQLEYMYRRWLSEASVVESSATWSNGSFSDFPLGLSLGIVQRMSPAALASPPGCML
jgi:hypothetical protein